MLEKINCRSSRSFGPFRSCSPPQPITFPPAPHNPKIACVIALVIPAPYIIHLSIPSPISSVPKPEYLNFFLMFKMLRLPRTLPFRWRRLAFFGSAFLLFWIFVFSLTPLTSPLPPYTGQHEVGVLDVETEVERRVVAEGVLRDNGDTAFEVC